MQSLIERARLIATAARYGQFRRDGVTPYITHPEAVASAVEDRLKPIAWLHDVVEDTWLTIESLRAARFPDYVFDGVYWLTKRLYEPSYEDYIDRLIMHGGIDAITVKIADMKHNLSCNPSPNSLKKSEWALPALEYALYALTKLTRKP